MQKLNGRGLELNYDKCKRARYQLLAFPVWTAHLLDAWVKKISLDELVRHRILTWLATGPKSGYQPQRVKIEEG